MECPSCGSSVSLDAAAFQTRQVENEEQFAIGCPQCGEVFAVFHKTTERV